ncbi:MAG: 30S ribosomal protein S1 [Gammaproteobacteria bacterium]
MAESFAQLFEQSLVDLNMRPGTIVSATVVDVRPDAVVVSAGLKSEGVIEIEQFRNEAGQVDVAVGDRIDVALEALEDGSGATRFSRKKAREALAWKRLGEAMEQGQYVMGVISDKVKGGFTVEIEDIRAFLPGSLVDVRPVRDTSYLEGKPLEFKVIKVDQKRNNVVVSRRAVVEREGGAEREALLDNLADGAVVKGVVKNLTDYGAFIDLGGLDGLLHITDLAWRRVKHPSEVISVGEEIEVKVLKFDRERNRVSLGLKQLGEDPWVDIARRYPQRSRVFGKVTNVAEYGCFVEIEPGVEGLVHVSEMDWTNKNVHPSKLVHAGQEVEAMVLDIDGERRRISLGLKQCQPNPWEEFAARNNKNSRVTGVIKSITDFGIFIGLDGGIDGLIHLSDLSWSETGEEAVRSYRKGQEIEAVVLAIDSDRERISLGVKQLERDPFSAFLADHEKGSVATGVVQKVESQGAVIKLAEGVEGYIRAGECSRNPVDDARKVLKEGQAIDALVTGIDRKKRSIALSIKAREVADEAQAVEAYGASGTAARTKLGDLLKQRLEGSEGPQKT